MLSHYIKVTFRELLKYRTQSIISIIGLAIGFTAFILGGYWLWWETHFDNFHPEADRLYCLTTEGLVKRANGTQADLDQLHINDREELFKLLPEIEASCSFNHLSFTLQLTCMEWKAGSPFSIFSRRILSKELTKVSFPTAVLSF